MKVAIRKTERTRANPGQKSKDGSNKSLAFDSAQTRTQFDETGKLSIPQCKAILCRDGAVYSDDQVALIRQVLYALAEVDYKYHTRLKEEKQNTTIPIHTTHDEQQDRYSLHPRIYRRTG